MSIKLNFICISLISLILFNFSICDITNFPNLIEKFNIRQIRKGINDVLPGNIGHIAIKFKVYDITTNEIVFSGDAPVITGMSSVPLCMNYALNQMNEMERVRLTCPAEFGFLSEHQYRFNGIKVNTPYIIDVQLWKIGNIKKAVE